MSFNTKNGYDFYEVSSALQKAIRRSDEKQAMYWAVELYDSNMESHLWKRLLVMSTEDIGLGAMAVHTHLRALRDTYNEMKIKDDKRKPERLFLVQAVLMMVRCKKSRLVDWALNYYWDSHKENTPLEIPDYALDIHTKRGKAKGKTINSFLNEGSHLNDHALLDKETEYKEWCRVRWNAMDGKDSQGNIDASLNPHEIKMMMGKFDDKPVSKDENAKPKQESLFN